MSEANVSPTAAKRQRTQRIDQAPCGTDFCVPCVLSRLKKQSIVVNVKDVHSTSVLPRKYSITGRMESGCTVDKKSERRCNPSVPDFLSDVRRKPSPRRGWGVTAQNHLRNGRYILQYALAVSESLCIHNNSNPET